MAKKEEKTNAMRTLEQKKIAYTHYEYPHEEGIAVDGVTVAESLGQNPDTVFKTLVVQGVSRQIYVLVIPVAESLDLKKSAKAVGEKSIDMVHVKDILALTGYVRGGCSPVGMKKQYPVFFHESAETVETIIVSAGKIGHQIALSPQDLIPLVRGKLGNLIIE